MELVLVKPELCQLHIGLKPQSLILRALECGQGRVDGYAWHFSQHTCGRHNEGEPRVCIERQRLRSNTNGGAESEVTVNSVNPK